MKNSVGILAVAESAWVLINTSPLAAIMPDVTKSIGISLSFQALTATAPNTMNP
ncbi:hypothetical protein DSCW_50820 [Desulfosarcina widdelii]|uniref:Uncharacterized protein n=1 Tax=Desulfosarcina widdelii TaxID=947919 RepID=A0A5K7ZAB6_9BACT|nr:hypothetical protein DSCW_50820 [Desulfosarcina widdelii]